MPAKVFPKAALTIIALCVLMAIWSRLGQPMSERIALMTPFLFSLNDLVFAPEIRSGEFWRLVTPAFVHFSIFHIGFNCATMYILGSVAEYAKGPLMLSILCLIAAIVSNTVQYIAGDTLLFGGLSGVVYAVFGWLWMQSQFNHTLHLNLPKQFIVIMLISFALCWFGVIPGVANWAHTAGLLTGMLMGFFGAHFDNFRVERSVRRRSDRG